MNEMIRELHMTHALDGFPLLLCDADSLSTRWKWRIFVRILSEQLKELFWILTDKLCKLWVTGTDLLQDWFQHMRLRLNNLSKLLKLRIRSEEVEIA